MPLSARQAVDNVPQVIAAAAEPFDSIEAADYTSLLNRIGNARVALIGEASHGTSEFYRMRERISRAATASRCTSTPST